MSKMADSVSPKEARLNLAAGTGVTEISDMRCRVGRLSQKLGWSRAYKLGDMPSRMDLCENNWNEGYFSLQPNT